jgi:hypothetical protein
MFDLPPTAGAARDAAILAHVTSGDYDAIEWSPITVQAGGHTGVFQVFSDALKISGVRINVSASLEQRIADLTDCLLLTPRLSDLRWLARNTTLPPFPQATADMTSTAAMVQQSHTIEAALAGKTRLIATVGKEWALVNALGTHPGRACNYGWHETAPKTGIPYVPGVTPQTHVIQGIGLEHDASWVDYSQKCVLASRFCVVDGQISDLATVLQDPVLSALASHEGPLKVLRQPGVPPVAPLPNAPGGLQNVSFGGTITKDVVQLGLGGITLAGLAGGFLAGMAWNYR